MISNEERECLVGDYLRKFPDLPECLIRMVIADEHGCQPGPDLGRNEQDPVPPEIAQAALDAIYGIKKEPPGRS